MIFYVISTKDIKFLKNLNTLEGKQLKITNKMFDQKNEEKYITVTLPDGITVYKMAIKKVSIFKYTDEELLIKKNQ